MRELTGDQRGGVITSQILVTSFYFILRSTVESFPQSLTVDFTKFGAFLETQENCRF